MVPVTLSGGSGRRLWPLSREAFPKQSLRLAGEDSMLQDTWYRLASLEVIEVGTGSCIGEDDIVRFADVYRR